MRFFSLIITTLLLSTACLSAGESVAKNCNHHCRRSNNEFIPSFRLVLTPDFCTDWAAVSFLGEAGIRNYRANGTVGFAIAPCSRVKVGGEWLTQKLGYHFSSGKEHRWMHQYAVGGAYQYLLDCSFIQTLDIYGHYCHSNNKRLRTVKCLTIPSIDQTVKRRIAGADAYNVGGGFTICPWYCANLLLSADYDNVRYNRKFRSHKKVRGWGGSVGFFQCLPCDFTLGFRGEFRRPYNYIEALLGWSTHTRWGDVNIGIYGGHTYGKDHLPSTSVAGLAIYWDFGNCCDTTCCDTCSPCTPCNDLARWISIAPAVYVPIVLAIAEQRTNVNIIPPPPPVCVNPTVIATTGPFEISSGDLPFPVQTAQLFDFHGQTPTFSLVTDSVDVDATIDPVTGLVTIITLPGDMTHTFTVTATVPGGCSATTSFQATLTE